MEIPRFWRLSASTKGFRTQLLENEAGKPEVLRFPGGEIPITDDISEVEGRLLAKGFKPEFVEKILLDLFGAISTEATVAQGEMIEGFLQLLRSEVGEESRSETKF